MRPNRSQCSRLESIHVTFPIHSTRPSNFQVLEREEVQQRGPRADAARLPAVRAQAGGHQRRQAAAAPGPGRQLRQGLLHPGDGAGGVGQAAHGEKKNFL